MQPEARLISQIREFVRSEHQEKSPDLEDWAEQYAEICSAVNERLLNCLDFLDKGMRSEAVHEAGVPPPLIELVDTLNFREVTKWRNICGDFGMRVFPMLRLDIVDRLRKECEKEQKMAPLLKEYRRLVHQGDREACIAVLRRIRESDPQNPVWEENLAPLEEEQITRRIAELETALREHDISRLRLLHRDLTDPQRVVKAPPEILGRIDRVLNEARHRDVIFEARTLSAQVAAAFSKKNETELVKLLTQWRQLVGDDDSAIPSDLAGPVAESAHWVRRREQERREQAEFNETLAQLRLLTAAGIPDRDLVQEQWRKATAAGREIPMDVREDVTNAFNRLDAIAANRRRRKMSLITAAVVLVAVVAMAGGIIHYRIGKAGAHYDNLALLVQSRDFERARDYLERLESRNPSVFYTPDVQSLRAKVEIEFQRSEEAETLFSAVSEQLAAVKRQTYNAPEEQIRQLLVKAAELAPDSRRRGSVEAWETDWELHKSRVQETVDREFLQRVNTARQAYAARAAATGDFEAEERQLRKVQELMVAAGALKPQASPAHTRQLNELLELADDWQGDLTERRDAFRSMTEQRERTLRAIPNVLPDFDTFRELLTGYVDDFPRDVQTPFFRRLIAEVPLYRDAVSLGGFRMPLLPLDAQQVQAVRAMLPQLPDGEGSVWYKDLDVCLHYTKRLGEAVEDLGRLKRMESLGLKVFYAKKKGTPDWRPVYHIESIMSRSEKLEDGTDATLYWGRVYWSPDGKGKPELVHMKFEPGLYELKIGSSEQQNLAPHAAFVQELVAEIPTADKVELFLLRKIEKLLPDTSMRPVPRAELLRTLVDMAASCVFGGATELVQLQELLKTIELDVPWMNHVHPDVVKTDLLITGALKKTPSLNELPARIMAERALWQKALGRRLSFAGTIVREQDDRLTFNLKTPGAASVWVIANAGGHRQFVQVGRRSGRGELQPVEGAANHLFSGQVLFAPSDGETAQEIIRDLKINAIQSVRWPSAWPVNAR